MASWYLLFCIICIGFTVNGQYCDKENITSARFLPLEKFGLTPSTWDMSRLIPPPFPREDWIQICSSYKSVFTLLALDENLCSVDERWKINSMEDTLTYICYDMKTPNPSYIRFHDGCFNGIRNVTDECSQKYKEDIKHVTEKAKFCKLFQDNFKCYTKQINLKCEMKDAMYLRNLSSESTKRIANRLGCKLIGDLALERRPLRDLSVLSIIAIILVPIVFVLCGCGLTKSCMSSGDPVQTKYKPSKPTQQTTSM